MCHMIASKEFLKTDPLPFVQLLLIQLSHNTKTTTLPNTAPVADITYFS